MNYYVADWDPAVPARVLAPTVADAVNDGSPTVKGLESHLYVVEIINHGVKVGRSESPANRIRAHASTARSWGREIGRVAISMPTAQFNVAETSLINQCQAAAPAHSREYISLGFDEALEILRSIPLERGDAEAFHARNGAVSEMFKSFVMGGGARV